MSKVKQIQAKYREKYAPKIAEFQISGTSRVCTICANFDASKPVARQCSAFPDGIPLEIWTGENNHTSAYPGDGGIRFQAIGFKRAA